MLWLGLSADRGVRSLGSGSRGSVLGRLVLFNAHMDLFFVLTYSMNIERTPPPKFFLQTKHYLPVEEQLLLWVLSWQLQLTSTRSS